MYTYHTICLYTFMYMCMYMCMYIVSAHCICHVPLWGIFIPLRLPWLRHMLRSQRFGKRIIVPYSNCALLSFLLTSLPPSLSSLPLSLLALSLQFILCELCELIMEKIDSMLVNNATEVCVCESVCVCVCVCAHGVMYYCHHHSKR